MVPGERRRLVLPVRWHLAALAIGAVLPSVVLAAWLASNVVEEERAALDARLVERARGLSHDVDLEMNATFRALQTLAQTPLLDAPPDLTRFRELLVRALRIQPAWRRVVLHDLAGKVVVHTGDGDDVRDLASFKAVRAGQQPTVGNLVRSTTGEWSFPLRVPIFRDGRLGFVLSVAITPEAIAGLIGRQPSGEEYTRSVVDAQDVVVARTREPERFVGTPSTPLFRQRSGAVPPGHGAVFRTLTLEGARGYTAVHRSAGSGWLTCIVLPEAVVEGPMQRRVATLGATAFGLLLLGAGGAFLLGRRLSRAFSSAAVAAEALAHGGTPPVSASSIREVADLRAALLRSSDLLRAREEERDRHLARADAALRDAEAASKVKDEFLAMLGHELRNPLAPLRTAVEVLRLRGGTSRELDVLERQTLQLTRLVDDLLDVSRSARGQLSIERRPIRLGPVVACAVEMAGALVSERRHQVTVDLPDDLATDGDAARLAQVIGNLVTNAAKYTPPGGHIRLRGRRDGDEVELTVEDDGLGIAPELLPCVFDLFVQGPRAADRQEGGLGIGLSIARSLVEAHGGRIEARSEGPGKGSAFVIRLPAAAAPPPEPAPARRPEAGRVIRVLVVDDNADGAETLAELLTEEGHEVATAASGPEALEAAKERRFDVAILDIGLPSMDGYELAGALRAVERPVADPAAGPSGRIGLIALTGYGQARDVERAKAAGFDRHFVKPPDIMALLRAVVTLGRPEPAA